MSLVFSLAYPKFSWPLILTVPQPKLDLLLKTQVPCVTAWSFPPSSRLVLSPKLSSSPSHPRLVSVFTLSYWTG